MNVSDLRLGNFVYDVITIVEIDAINRKGVVYNRMGATIHAPIKVDRCQPIILTEEWLIKFGFDVEISKIRADRKTFTKDGFHYYSGNHFFEFRGVSLIIKYVHDLQNLYFALNGEELVCN